MLRLKRLFSVAPYYCLCAKAVLDTRLNMCWIMATSASYFCLQPSSKSFRASDRACDCRCLKSVCVLCCTVKVKALTTAPWPKWVCACTSMCLCLSGCFAVAARKYWSYSTAEASNIDSAAGARQAVSLGNSRHPAAMTHRKGETPLGLTTTTTSSCTCRHRTCARGKRNCWSSMK